MFVYGFKIENVCLHRYASIDVYVEHFLDNLPIEL